MRITDFVRKLNQVKSALITNRAADAFLIAKEALSLIRLRIQNTGERADGQQLGDYSDTDLPAFFFFGKSANAAGETKVRKAAKDKQKISYSDFREFNNRPTKFVNLTFTGAMWREMNVDITTNTRTMTVATIEPRTARSRKVALYNSQRYGDILALSKREIAMVKEANRLRIIKIFREYLK